MTNLSNAERRILVVDDDSNATDIICEALGWEGYQFKSTLIGAELSQLVENWQPHLIILDVNTTGVDWLSALKEIRQRERYIAVMFISGDSRPEALVESLDAGADDFLLKPFDPTELLARVRARFRTKDLYDNIYAANNRLKELVEIDDLTGLFNMRSTFQRLGQEMERAKRYHRQVAVVMMDMDHFKSVNDGHNHLFGSYVLSQIGKLIAKSIRPNDIAARYGGDEFMIVLTETNEEGAMAFCERLRRRIEGTVFKSGRDQIQLTASLGFAMTSAGDDTMEPKALVRCADSALYAAKRAGRNCVREEKVPERRRRKAS